MTAVIIGAFGIVIFIVAYTRGRADGFWWGSVGAQRKRAQKELSNISDALSRINSPEKPA